MRLVLTAVVVRVELEAGPISAMCCRMSPAAIICECEAQRLCKIGSQQVTGELPRDPPGRVSAVRAMDLGVIQVAVTSGGRDVRDDLVGTVGVRCALGGV